MFAIDKIDAGDSVITAELECKTSLDAEYSGSQKRSSSIWLVSASQLFETDPSSEIAYCAYLSKFKLCKRNELAYLHG